MVRVPAPTYTPATHAAVECNILAVAHLLSDLRMDALEAGGSGAIRMGAASAEPERFTTASAPRVRRSRARVRRGALDGGRRGWR